MPPEPNKLRIAFVPETREWGGGIFQYSQTMLGVLAELREKREEDFVLLADDVSDDHSMFEGVAWEIAPLTPPRQYRFRSVRLLRSVARRTLPLRVRTALRSDALRLRRGAGVVAPDTPRPRPDFTAWFDSLGIDLIIYPTSNPLSFEAGTPYVLAVHDLQHRLHPEFPEVSAGGEFANREYAFINGIREATMVLVDSEVGKEDVVDQYGELIAPDRIAVLPFLPATQERSTPEESKRVRRKYRLPERYLFYPAQLWPHKNHLHLVGALAELERTHGIAADLLLVGARSGKIRKQTYKELMSRVRKLGLKSRVHYHGYVPQADMTALYVGAEALVMPTFFGPTNIPVLEAWGLDCPVITSDIRGVREQAGDAALLADPRSEEELAETIARLWVDADLRSELVRRGRARLALYTREDYTRRLGEILDQAGEIVSGSRGR